MWGGQTQNVQKPKLLLAFGLMQHHRTPLVYQHAEQFRRRDSLEKPGNDGRRGKRALPARSLGSSVEAGNSFQNGLGRPHFLENGFQSEC